MDTIKFSEAYSKFNKKLLSSRWLLKWDISKNTVQNHIKDACFINNLSHMIENKDFTCKSTLNLCSNMIKDICVHKKIKDIPDNWLKYIYEYTLYKSFENAITIELRDELNGVCELYLRSLRIVCELQKQSDDGSFQSRYPLEFLTYEEEKGLENDEEYRKFLKAFNHNYTYEMMKLHYELTGFNTLDHICGVHFLSLYIARQLKHIGINIDLGRVSGSAAGHDIGKYGCKGPDLKRVPYLHYYYSDQWFKRYEINYIRNIAINHSTWDLELENLPLESLILIYSDFRVKNIRTDSGEEMHIFSLKDSFQVILNKLDNLDGSKEKRYKRVYSKLKDFEEFLKSLNICCDIIENFNIQSIEKPKTPDYALMQGEKVVNSIKNLAINHNINLMYILRDEYSLDTILEAARSENNWKNLREYIRIFEEYSTYLTQKQKIQTMKFLYENLVHPEDDIRRHCADLIGTLIAIFDEDYRKEIPENVKLEPANIKSADLFNEYLERLLFPGHKIIPAHRYWLGYSISIFSSSLFKNCRKELIPSYRGILLKYYNSNKYKNSELQLFLLENIKAIPLEPFSQDLDILFNFILDMLNKRNIMLRLSALQCCIDIMPKVEKNTDFVSRLKKYLSEIHSKSSNSAENMLRLNLCNSINDEENMEKLRKFYESDNNKIADIFLNNLKTATDWVRKKYQVALIADNALSNNNINAMHAAIHFCNLLKVSAVESVRNEAGKAILTMMVKLSPSERNEVAIELLRALEIEGHKFTEYIPRYLGEVLLYLQPKELDEVIDDLSFKIKISTPAVKNLILKTASVMAENYDKYKYNFKEDEKIYEKRLINILGIILNGLSDYNISVKQAAFTAIGKGLFGSSQLNLEQKCTIFKLIGKKVLTLVVEDDNEELLFLSNSAGLNHIYRFISDYSFFKGEINLNTPKNIAFFPGTFDPFSLSHKEIAKNIRDLGYEVYLAIDEFSWSKKPLPNLIRRNILNMSISGELGIFIYPDSFPTNISNEEDLKILKNNFKSSEVYIVVGSDVLLNASSYKAPKSENSIHSFSHIIFQRNKSKQINDAIKNIQGNVEILLLPPKYTDISSSQIRNYIDENRDISSLVDPLAQKYIYENGFYQREALDKSTLNSAKLDVEVINTATEELLDICCHMVDYDCSKIQNRIKKVFSKPSGRALILRNSKSKKIVGFSLYHWIRSSMLYEELKDVKLADEIRQNSLGRIILLDGIYIKEIEKNRNLEQILLTETLAFCISKDYEYTLFNCNEDAACSPYFQELLSNCGFININEGNSNQPIWLVNMSTPSVINLDLENLIKEPFRSNAKVKQSIKQSRHRLLKALCNLYPAELILPIDNNMLHYGLIKKICKENNVPTETIIPRFLGKSMCVPYGDMLDRYIIPNTVTKSLHTEKYFESDISSFKISEFPHYMDLNNQIKMLKSFNRPIILVDNLLHKGHRMQAIDPIFKKEHIDVQKIIVGILSARGKDLMDYQHREVDCVYFIPRMKLWFNENALYPFIGGDSLWRGKFPERNLLPSINLLMPYTSPKFIKGAPNKSLFELSKICIDNAIDILITLENEYHIINERNLTLSSLGQVFTIPRCPDHGRDMNYDLSLNPSHYLKNDLETLNRLENILGR